MLLARSEPLAERGRALERARSPRFSCIYSAPASRVQIGAVSIYSETQSASSATKLKGGGDCMRGLIIAGALALAGCGTTAPAQSAARMCLLSVQEDGQAL